MKTLKVLVPLIFLVSLLFPMALFAQEATPEVDTVTMQEALEIVRAAYGADVVIVEISFDNADDDDDFGIACWDVRFADGSEICVDAVTGEILLDVEETPEATEDADDDSDDDRDDDDDNGNDDDAVTGTPLISLDEAIAAALNVFPNGTVSSVELEIEAGVLVWDVDLGDESVDVDATTGAVLDFGYENDDDDDGDDQGDDDNDDGDDDNNDDDDDDDNDDDENDDDENDDDENDDDDDSDDDDDGDDD